VHLLSNFFLLSKETECSLISSNNADLYMKMKHFELTYMLKWMNISVPLREDFL